MSNLSPDERRDLLEQFLDRWPEEKVRRMTLSEYVDINNKETFNILGGN
jgi:5-methylcytosine-specific restriction enzyme B